MIISKSQVAQVLRAYAKRAESKSPKAIDDAGGSRGTSRLRGDSVSLSVSAEDIQGYARVLQKIPDVREDKVEALSARIRCGEYDVKAEDIADKILGRSVVDELA